MSNEREETEVKSKQELIEEWESAIEAAEFYGKGKEERLISYMKDFVSDLDQLDEPEVLSQEWTERNTSPVDDEGRLYIWKKDLQNLLMPKQELPVIPKFVADVTEEITEGEALDKIVESYPLTPNDIPWILDRYVAGVIVEQPERPVIPDYVAEWINRNRTLGTSISYLMNYDKIKAHNRQLHLWCYEGENDDNLHKLARAWLDGFTVEEKQKYYVEDGKHALLCKWESLEGWKVISTIESTEDDIPIEVLDYGLTEQEIKDYDPRFWPFAVKVEELEE